MIASLSAPTQEVFDGKRRIDANALDQRDVVRDLTQALCAHALAIGEPMPALTDRVPDLATAALACTRLQHALRNADRLADGTRLTLPVLLRWRVRLLDQLRFELGDERYEDARLDQAAQQLWLELEG